MNLLKKYCRTSVIAVILASLFSVSVVSQVAADGITWTSRTAAADNFWLSVAYGNGLWVAVSFFGTVMTSRDGITWTSRTSAADNAWFSVAYGNGLWVAVSNTGTGNRVMTSPDGITWTSRTAAADIFWNSVAYGNGLWVAVSDNETGNITNRVMTSPDGITWTSRTAAADNDWRSVAYGDGLWVAVSQTGTGNRVMTSGVIGTAARTAEAARVAAVNAYAYEAAAAAEANRTLIIKLLHATANTAASYSELALVLLKKLDSSKCVKGKTTKYVKSGTKCPKGYVKKK